MNVQSKHNEFEENVLKALDVGQSKADSLLLAKKDQSSDDPAFWVLSVKVMGARNLVSRDTEMQMSTSLSSLSQSASSVFFSFSSDPYAVLCVGTQVDFFDKFFLWVHFAYLIFTGEANISDSKEPESCLE